MSLERKARRGISSTLYAGAVTAPVTALWLARDADGNVGLFECDEGSALRRGKAVDRWELAARVVAAFVARDGGERLPAHRERDGAERAFVVLDRNAPGADYRSRAEILAVEEQVPEGEWAVALEGNPRVLFSRRPLGTKERELLRARADCVALLGEDEVDRAAKHGDLFFYEEDDGRYARDDRRPPEPLRADEVAGVDFVRLRTSFRAWSVVELAPKASAVPGDVVWRRDRKLDLDSVLAIGCVPGAFFGIPALVACALVMLGLSEAGFGATVLIGVLVAIMALVYLVRWLREPIRVRVQPRRPKLRVASDLEEQMARAEAEPIGPEPVSEEGSPRSRSAESRSSLRKSR